MLLTALLIVALAVQTSALFQTDIIYQMDDTYVNSSAADTNYDSGGLIINNSNQEIWFRFNLSDPTGYYVTQAMLYTYINSLGESDTFEMQDSVSATWTETNLTWNNKPAANAAVDSHTVSSTGWDTWDLTDDYSGEFDSGTAYVSYVMTGSKSLTIEDKENTFSTGNAPYLNLTMMIPEVFLLSPGDGSSTYSSTATFQYNTTDAGNILNCSLILDGALNMTNTSAPTNASSTFTRDGLFPGSHTWTVRCYDSGRYIYQIEPAARDLDVLAKVEWYNPGSATDLDIGSSPLGSREPGGSRQVYSNNTNQNAGISCASGDCGVITTNWSTMDMTDTEVAAAYFNCSTSTAGSFQAHFELTSDQDSSADTLTVNCSVLAPDLRVNSTNITFSDSTPTEGQPVTVTAGIYNDGTYNATNAVVRIYEGHYSAGTHIGTDHTINLTPGSSTTVQESWTAKIGSHDIYAVLDPPVDTNGSIDEIDESNNYAYNTIEIPMWTVFVGNVTGWLALQSSQNKTVLKWNITDTTESIIYVTDTDSNPDFNSLTAFSRNTTGSYTQDDFTELDQELNTTSFPDSLNLTYTSAGSPIRTETFTVFGVQIDDVPVVNSTNTSSFVTGIFWDSSDDSNSNHQFDTTSDEDIIMVTRVNKTKQGMYGTYDYEIKVPARLKNYKEPDVLTVTFYTEIK